MILAFKENGYTFRGDNPIKIDSVPSGKGITLKGEELFSFMNPSFEGPWCPGKQTRSHKSCFPCEMAQNIQMYTFSFFFFFFFFFF